MPAISRPSTAVLPIGNDYLVPDIFARFSVLLQNKWCRWGERPREPPAPALKIDTRTAPRGGTRPPTPLKFATRNAARGDTRPTKRSARNPARGDTRSTEGSAPACEVGRNLLPRLAGE